MAKGSTTTKLSQEIKACVICRKHLPHKPKPIFSFHTNSKIVLIGQAPGVKVHRSGVPWQDASGDRLRDWLGVSDEEFYDTKNFAIVPMGFCYPGKGSSGDLPPRPECAPQWMDTILAHLKKRRLILLIGQYSQKYFLQEKAEKNLTLTVKKWKQYYPKYMVLPHPSPRNNIWLKKNPWFEKDLLRVLKRRIRNLL